MSQKKKEKKRSKLIQFEQNKNKKQTNLSKQNSKSHSYSIQTILQMKISFRELIKIKRKKNIISINSTSPCTKTHVRIKSTSSTQY